MQKKLLIDASHQEETRIVLLNHQQVEEFDFESISKKQIAGNIFLAKVTRVEPSLQAAFLDYGGNRHGFLAFSEIHPDYYQIPIADKKLFLEDTYIDNEEKNEHTEIDLLSSDFENFNSVKNDEFYSNVEGFSTEDKYQVNDFNKDLNKNLTLWSDIKKESAITQKEEIDHNYHLNFDLFDDIHKTKTVQTIDSLTKESNLGKQKRPVIKNKYKIQEVIKVRQVLLIQVVKDERGNKGAALTTYISLAGRYCVLMPNTARGGGISRKITNIGDRKKLKETANEFSIPDKMGLIIRTAGAKKTKSEIKKDYEYLLRQWNQIRNLTIKSIAPCPIYEEGSVIKRTIRDLYSKEINEIMVEGETGFNEAKEYMKMLMPTHSKKIKQYTNKKPIFSFYGVEDYLSGMFNPTVQLKSGGYIVIGITEALVAIDVNSGKATKESGIEETALRTNLEAADEISRQLRMRDLAGLIVIDFIDMDERKNNNSVEKKIRDSLKIDRARIQVGKISTFGLLEMSRQRLRYGMIEATTKLCENCHGTGLTRSSENLSLSILRKLDNLDFDKKINEINVKVPIDVANYILNQKRRYLEEIEKELKTNIFVISDITLINPNYVIETNKNSNNKEEDIASSNIITMDGGNINNLTEDLNKSLSIDNNSHNNENIKDTNFKKPKRRRRKNSKFRKFDHITEEKQPHENLEKSKVSPTNQKVRIEGNKNNEDIKKPAVKDTKKSDIHNTIKPDQSHKNKKIKSISSDLNNKNSDPLEEKNIAEKRKSDSNNESVKKTLEKPIKKRVVKKVKEVLNEKYEVSDQKKSNNNKTNSESKTSKSGWWSRKI
ncbi:MAG: ribonuclease E/G [Paracoccaceae bacterium]